MNTRKQKTNPLIISILLHLLMLVYFFFFAFRQNPKVMLAKLTKQRQQQQQRQQEMARRMRAALFPKRSDEGTQIVFDDTKIIPKPKREAKQEPAKVIEKKLFKQESKTKFIEPVDTKKLALKNLLKEQNVVEEKEQEEIVEKKEKKKSLLSLTKCFLDHEKGNSAMCRSGEDRKLTLEELKYICYEKQIQDALVASWKFLYAGTHIVTPGETKFTFVINEKGQAEQIVLCRSSGNKMFDNMVLESVKQTVFPPIPKHFGVTKYRPQGGIIVLR